MAKQRKKEIAFRRFQAMNAARCNAAFPSCWDWSLNDWAVALAGEAGELCNLLKKIRRGDRTVLHDRAEILAELADVITYADLMMTKLGADTGEELLKKFAEVSRRVGYSGTGRGA